MCRSMLKEHRENNSFRNHAHAYGLRLARHLFASEAAWRAAGPLQVIPAACSCSRGRSLRVMPPLDLSLLSDPSPRPPAARAAVQSAPLPSLSAEGRRSSRSGALSLEKSRAARRNDFLLVPSWRLTGAPGDGEAYLLFAARRGQRGGRFCSSKRLPCDEKLVFYSNKPGLVWLCSTSGWGMERPV